MRPPAPPARSRCGPRPGGGHAAEEAIAAADTTDGGTEGALGAETLAVGEFGDANTDADAISEADADTNAAKEAG